MRMKSYLLTALALGLALLSHAQQSWVGTWAAAAEFTGKGDMPASPPGMVPITETQPRGNEVSSLH